MNWALVLDFYVEGGGRGPWCLITKMKLQSTVVPTVVLLHTVAAGGLSMPTNECSKGGELFATVQLSNSSHNHHHTHPTHIHRKGNFVCHCTPLSDDRFQNISPQGRAYRTYYSTTQLLQCKPMVVRYRAIQCSQPLHNSMSNLSVHLILSSNSCFECKLELTATIGHRVLGGEVSPS